MVEYVLISYDISIQSNWGDLTMCIKHSTIKRWRSNWGVMVDRQMPFDDKVLKLNHFSREPLLLRLCLHLGLLIHTLHWLWFGGTTWAPYTYIHYTGFDLGAQLGLLVHFKVSSHTHFSLSLSLSKDPLPLFSKISPLFLLRLADFPFLSSLRRTPYLKSLGLWGKLISSSLWPLLCAIFHCLF